MENTNKAALLLDYQDMMVRYINNHPEAMDNLNWCTLTNGFDSDLVKYFVMNVKEEEVMNQLVEQLSYDWDWWQQYPEPRFYLDEERRYLKYGSPANPIRFNVYLNELSRMWKIVNG